MLYMGWGCCIGGGVLYRGGGGVMHRGVGVLHRGMGVWWRIGVSGV